MTEMTEHRAHAALARSLSRLAVGNPKEDQRREAELASMRPGNMVQAVQLPVAGTASPAVSSALIPLTFEHPFLSPLSPDESDLTVPHFSEGAEVHSDGAVIVHSQVTDWTYDDSGLIVGAKVKVVTHGDAVDFSATVHLSFTGYAAPSDDDDDGDAAEVTYDAQN